jgi:5-methylcytosine-specific restriction endonuclease McrA
MAASTVSHDKLVVTRHQAKAAGAARFFTGRPCVRGHIGERYTANKVCIACALMHGRRQYEENKDSYIKRMNDWNKANPARAKDRLVRWLADNPEKSKAIKKKWSVNNPDKIRAIVANQRARRVKATGTHTAGEIARLFKIQKGKCANPACRVTLGTKYHRDHIMPLVRGGTNDVKNIQLLCPSCNRSKWTKHPIEWAQQNELLV